MMKREVEIKRIAIIAELSDGTYKQVLIDKEEQNLWLGVLHNFYNPIKILDHNIEGLFFEEILKKYHKNEPEISTK